MKKSKLFYLIGGLTSIPIVIGVGLMGGFAQNFNEYNNIKEQVNLAVDFSKKFFNQEITPEMKDALFHGLLADAIRNSTILDSEKEKLKQYNQNFYNQIKNNNNIDNSLIKIIELNSKLNYVYPEQSGFISGAVIFSISLATIITLLLLAFHYKKKEKLEKQNNLENKIPLYQDEDE